MSSKPAVIGYFGENGSYTNQAASELFKDREFHSYRSISAAVAGAERGEVDAVVLPVENSTAGRVAELYQLLDRMNLYICGEHFLEIKHCLVSATQTQLTGDGANQSVLSHQQALLQCSGWLDANLPAIDRVSAADTATAAKQVAMKKDPDTFAICSPYAAELNGLNVVASDIQDDPGNVTRFLVLSGNKQIEIDVPLNREKVITTLILELQHVPGALSKVLTRIADYNVSILKLETYMVSGARNLPTFYIDLAFDRMSESGQKMLGDLMNVSSYLKVAGSYPSSSLRGSVTGFLNL